MPKVLKDLLLSKKFVVALLACFAAVAARYGWEVDTQTIIAVVSPFLVYIGAQGWADSGKEKAKVDQTTALMIRDRITMPPPPPPVQKNSETSFIKTAVVLAVLFLGATVGLPVACMRATQVTLRAGQCVLDSGVLGDVIAALDQPDYVQRIEDIGIHALPELIDCALQAVASSDGSSQGSGSAASNMLPLVAEAPAKVRVDRAREVMTLRRTSRK